jgi:hypothetical protein
MVAVVAFHQEWAGYGLILEAAPFGDTARALQGTQEIASEGAGGSLEVHGIRG